MVVMMNWFVRFNTSYISFIFINDVSFSIVLFYYITKVKS